jgi:hypothetical protein
VANRTTFEPSEGEALRIYSVNNDLAASLLTTLPASIVPGSHPSIARGVAGLLTTPFPTASCNPFPHHITQSKASRSGDHRTSFAPETIAQRRDKHDQTRRIFRKINASNSWPDRS